jgi:hypothetical protein
VLGLVAFWEGEFEAARRHLQAAVDQFRPERPSDRLARFGTTTEVLSTSRLGNTLGFLGRPEAAAAARAAALARAAGSGQPHHREAALVFGAMLALELRDPSSVRAYGAELAARPGDLARGGRVVADALAGYVLVLDGQTAAGMDRIRRAPGDADEDDHAPGMHAMVARVLLEACVVAGDARTGLAAADGALGLGGDVRTWASEARRRRAEFLAALGAPADEAGRSCGARSRSPAARAPGCWSCGPRPACSATASTPATTARQTGSGCWRSSTPSPSEATPLTGARRPRSSPAAERGTLPGTLLERPAADPRPIEERRPR